jgi:hypothetical protein
MHTRQGFYGFVGGILAGLALFLVLGLVLLTGSVERSAAESGAGTDQISYGCVEAPISFTDGVTLTDFYVSVYDNDVFYSAVVNLWRVDNIFGTVTPQAAVETSRPGASDGLQVLHTASIAEPVVAYPDYAYYLTTCLRSTDIRLYSARVYFQAAGEPVAVPVVVPAAAFSSDGFFPDTHHFWFGGGYLEGAYALDLELVHLPVAIK